MKTGYSQKFQRELDYEQLLSLLKYDIQNDPYLDNLPQELRDEIRSDLICPECGARGGIIVAPSKSKGKKIRQAHFRFRSSNDENIHHPLCDFFDESNSKDQPDHYIDFINSKDRSDETKKIRKLVIKAISQGILSQLDIRNMRQHFFDIKVAHQFTMNISPEAVQWTSQLSRLFHHKDEVSFNPIHAELPFFDWRNAAINQFVKENRDLIKMAYTRWWRYCHEKLDEKTLIFVKEMQGQSVFDVTQLESKYRETIKLACFIARNLNDDKISNSNLLEGRIRAIVAFAALLLYISDWNIDLAISKLVKIYKAPDPIDENLGNVIGLNPFHDFLIWATIMKAKEVALHSPNGFDYESQINAIEQRLREEHRQWQINEKGYVKKDGIHTFYQKSSQI